MYFQTTVVAECILHTMLDGHIAVARLVPMGHDTAISNSPHA